MRETNCCSRCGQPFNLIDEPWAEDKAATWQNIGECCPRCYLDLIENNRHQLY